MYQTKDNLKGFPIAMYFLMMLAQLYSHSCLSRTQDGWIPHMDFPIPPLIEFLCGKSPSRRIQWYQLSSSIQWCNHMISNHSFMSTNCCPCGLFYFQLSRIRILQHQLSSFNVGLQCLSNFIGHRHSIYDCWFSLTDFKKFQKSITFWITKKKSYIIDELFKKWGDD